jgi:hypothetical protein
MEASAAVIKAPCEPRSKPAKTITTGIPDIDMWYNPPRLKAMIPIIIVNRGGNNNLPGKVMPRDTNNMLPTVAIIATDNAPRTNGLSPTIPTAMVMSINPMAVLIRILRTIVSLVINFDRSLIMDSFILEFTLFPYT